MLQRRTARTVVCHWGQGFKWHWSHGPFRVQVFFVSVETKTEIVTVNTEQVPVQTDTSLAFNIELPAFRNIRTHRIRRLFNW